MCRPSLSRHGCSKEASGSAALDPYETASLDTSTAALPARDLVSSPETTILSGQWAYAASERRPRIGVAEKVAPPARHPRKVDQCAPNNSNATARTETESTEEVT